MLAGFAMGLYLPIRWVIVADVSSTKTMASAYSWINISWLVGATVAPFVGGIIADSLGIHIPFFIGFMLRLAVVPLTFLIQETRKKPQAKDMNHENKQADMIDKYLSTVVLFSLINIIQGLGIGVTQPAIPVFVVSNFQVDFTFIGILYAIGFGFASIIVQIPGGKCSDLFDRRKVMFVTFIASSPFFLLFAFSRSTLELIVFMFLSRAILNLSWSPFQTLMMDATPSSKWGLINGISASTFWIGLLIGNALSGILWDSWGMLAPFYASSFAIGLSALLPLLLKETKGKVKRSSATK
jgi:MFS family permease